MGGSKIGLFIAPAMILAMTIFLYRQGAVSRTAASIAGIVTVAITAVLLST